MHQKNTVQSGFTLLYAMLVVAAVIGVTSAVAGVLVRELKLSDTRQRSLDAYYAAQSGLECAYSWTLERTAFDGTSDIECDGVSIPNVGANFQIDNSFCADVTVTSGGAGAPLRIESKGYDTCDNPATKRQVERMVYLSHKPVAATPGPVTLPPATPPSGCTGPATYDLHMGLSDAAPNRGYLDCGLLLHWSFNQVDISGVSVPDLSGMNNHGTFYGGGDYPSFGPGKYGDAIDLDGVDDQVATDAFLNLYGDFSLSAWVNMSMGATKGIAGSWDSYKFKAENDIIEFMVKVASGGFDRPTYGGFTSGTWHHLVLSFDSSEDVAPAGKSIVTAYVDGVAKDSGEVWGLRPKDAVRHFVVGCWGDSTGRCFTDTHAVDSGGGFNDGLIDDVRLYGRTLTNVEIQQLYLR